MENVVENSPLQLKKWWHKVRIWFTRWWTPVF